jgi:hypothetical protein
MRITDETHLPRWSLSVGGLLRAKAEVRFACERCRTLFDVDLKALAQLRGCEACLVNVEARCKVSACRGRGFFLAAPSRDDALFPLVTARPFASWTAGPTPRDFEPAPVRPIPPGHGGPRGGPALRLVGRA